METKRTMSLPVPQEVYSAISELNEYYSEIMYAITQAMASFSNEGIDAPIQDLAVLSANLKIIQEKFSGNPAI